MTHYCGFPVRINNDENLYLLTSDGDVFMFPIHLLHYSRTLQRMYGQGRGGNSSRIPVQCEWDVIAQIVVDLGEVARGQLVDTRQYEDDLLRRFILCANNLGISLVRDIYQAALDARQPRGLPIFPPSYESLGFAHRYLQTYPKEEIRVPPTLQSLCRGSVHQFLVTQQTGSACGNFAMFNALIVQELIRKQEPLSSSNLLQRSLEYLRYHMKNDYLLCEEDIATFGEKFGITATRIVAYDANKDDYYITTEIDNGQVTYLYESQVFGNMNRLYRELRTSTGMLVHFIFNTGGHWVTVSVLKYNNSLDIIYLDSLNSPIYEGSASYRFILSLCRQIEGIR